MKKARGFTLIEVLVVVTIVAILAALLFPVFAKAEEKGKQSTCISNVRQISVALQAYAQDFDGILPWCNDTTIFNAPTGNFTSWQDLIQPYLKSRAVLYCPSSPFLRRNLDGTPETRIGHYGCNRKIMGPGIAGAVTPLSGLRRPADTYLIMDAGGYMIQAYDAVGPGYVAGSGWFRYLPGSAPYADTPSLPTPQIDPTWTALNGIAQDDFKNGRHNGGVVVGFCDGHAKWLTAAEICREARKYISDAKADITSTSAWSP